jgi:hypothetical protein
MAEVQRPDLRNYPADKARQGDIILKTPVQRAIFIAGLAGIVVVALLAALVR